ncbi:MAG: 50S ribosomal protein L10 [Kiritimatiellaeota bacterium]|nr:50S ribosomal protein L10 [Kiritimatiellota bacterium]
MRPEKIAMVAELRSQVQAASFLILTDYRGLDVSAMTALRHQLHAAQAEFHVVQNRLLRVVARELGQPGLEPALKGPSAMVSGRGDMARAAKVLRDFSRDKNLPVVKLGVVQGAVLTPAEVAQIADLPPRAQLYGLLVGTLAAPMSGLVRALNQKLASIVYVLKAFQERKTKEQPQA